MTHEELKRTGKNGVYRADLDEWFIEGEEPTGSLRQSSGQAAQGKPSIRPLSEAEGVLETSEALSAGLDAPAPVSEASKKTTKLGKDHD